MKKKLKNTLFLILFSLGFLGVRDFCRKQTHGFTLCKARSSYGSKEDLQITFPELVSIQLILNQPFYFMEKGFQCYTFSSKDDKYVIKLLNWKALEPSLWTQYLPDSWLYSLKEEKRKKKEHDFESYRIAFNELKEETGLIYLHLHKTEGLHASLCLYDPIGICHHISADQIEFILQKKVDLFVPYFEENKNNEEKIFSFLSSFITALKQRIQKKIRDSDVSLEYNMGVLEGKPIFFDIGNLTRETENTTLPGEILQQEAKLALDWLRLNNPKFAHFLNQEIQLIDTK